VAEKRSNKWNDKTESDFKNPLGWRLLECARRMNITPRVLSEQAHRSKSKGGNLETQLERLRKGGKSLAAEQLLIYAREARVSLVWLLTGEGLPTQGLYGEATGEEMQAFPVDLQRAIRAAVELDGCPIQQALMVAGDLLAELRAKRVEPENARDWYDHLNLALRSAHKRSGIRPSTQPPRTG
jgi:hypothetical protein